MRLGFSPAASQRYPAPPVRTTSSHSMPAEESKIRFGMVDGADSAMYTIEKAVPDDAEGIQDLHSAVTAIMNPNRIYGVPLSWTQERINWWEEKGIALRRKNIQEAHQFPKRFFWQVAKNEWGQVVGFAQMKKEKKDVVDFLALYVHPDLQGSRIAADLMQKGIEWTRKNDCHKILLSVAPYNPAIAFYRRAGFKFIEDSFLLQDSVLPLIQMELDLDEVPTPVTGVHLLDPKELEAPAPHEDDRKKTGKRFDTKG